MAEAYIVAAARTAGGKRGGRLSGWHPVDLAAQVIDALLERSQGRPRAGGRRDHGLRAAGRRAERLHRPHGGAGLEAAASRAGSDHRPAMRFVSAGAAFRRPGGDVRHDGLRHRRGRGKHVAHSDGGAAQGLQGSGAGPLHEPDDPRALPRPRVQPVHGRGNDGREVPALQGRTRPLLAAEPSARQSAATLDGGFTAEIVPVAVRVAEGPAVDAMHVADEGIRMDATLEGIASVKLLREGGRITAASASQICDGASGVTGRQRHAA